MVTQEVTVKGNQKKEIQVRMKEDVNEVNEVVVTGYANLRKESFTGNTVSIKKEELQKSQRPMSYRLFRHLTLHFALQKITCGVLTRTLYRKSIFVVSRELG